MKDLQIGTCGWQHNSWQGTFYPDDLPEEWRLDYFSNAYDVLLVPQQAWQAWSQATLLDIVESVDCDFGIYLALENECGGALENTQTVAQLTDVLSVLGSRVLGFVVWSETAFANAMFLQRPVTLISSQCTLPGWQWQWDAIWMSGNPLGFVTQLPLEGKAQAELLTSFMASLPKTEEDEPSVTMVPLIVGGEKINMDQVANLKTIGELLGY